MSRGLREQGQHVASGVRVILAVPHAPPSISCFALATRSPGWLLKQDGDIAMFSHQDFNSYLLMVFFASIVLFF